MNPWTGRYEQALLRALRREPPATAPCPGERHLLALIEPTFHERLVVELTDLGEAHELAAAVIGEASSFAFDVASGRADAPLPLPPAWHRAALPPAPLAGLRSRLDALDARGWSPLDPGRDGIAVTLWLRDRRGRQRLDWSTATHDPAGAPGELTAVLLDLVAAAAPALGAAAAAARRYLRG